MSSTPSATQPPTGTAVDSATPVVTQESKSWRGWLESLNPLVKAGGVVALILILGAWYIFSGRVTTDDAQVDCHITAVAPQVPGYVVKLFINDNTSVKEGDVLLEIDPRTYEAEVEQAKAALDFAEAQ